MMTRHLGGFLVAFFAAATAACSGAPSEGDASGVDALRNDEAEPEAVSQVRLEGAVRAEWLRVSVSSTGERSTKRIRVAEGADKIEQVLSRLSPADAEPRCDYLKSVTNWGMRMGPDRSIPKTGETIVFFDDRDKRLGTLYLFPCESTLVTLKRGNAAEVSYRRTGSLQVAFTDTTE